MKTLLKIFLLLTIALAPMAASAQTQQKRRPDPSQREALAKAQAKEIAQKLNLSDELSARYTETFLKCQKEIWDIRRPKTTRVKTSEMTEAQAKEENESRFATEQKFLDIRKKYYTEYSKFLSQRQIMQANNLEKKMIDRMMEQARQKHSNTKKNAAKK